jgi:Domain of unknown function (DUF4129)
MPVSQPTADGRLRTAQTVAALVVAAAALALVAVAARSGRPETLTPVSARSPAAIPTVTATLQRPAPQAPPASPSTGWVAPHWLLVLLAVLGMACLLGFAAWLFRRSWDGRRLWSWRGQPAPAPDLAPDPQPDPAVIGALADAVDAGLRRLDEGAARDAVIACWVLLESAAAEAGTVRRPAETAAELTTRVLGQHRVTADVLHRLADRYREARYSTHLLGEDAREQARTALAQVREELAGEQVVR